MVTIKLSPDIEECEKKARSGKFRKIKLRKPKPNQQDDTILTYSGRRLRTKDDIYLRMYKEDLEVSAAFKIKFKFLTVESESQLVKRLCAIIIHPSLLIN